MALSTAAAMMGNLLAPYCYNPHLAQVLQRSSFSHPPSSPSSNDMAAMGSRKANTHLQKDRLDALSGSGGVALLWWVGEDQMESDHRRDVPSICTNPFILSISMEQTGWSPDQTSRSLGQEDEQALSDWLSDTEESDWSVNSEDDSSDDEQENDENEANDLWNSFIDHDPYNPMNFSASTGRQSVDQNKKLAEDSENDKQSDSYLQNPDPCNLLNTSVHTLTNGATDNRIMDGVQNAEMLEEVTAANPSLCENEHCSTPTVKPGACPLQGKTLKKVRFSPVVTVHPMIVWDFAYRAARRGPWEQCARDRSRFQRRIAEAEAVIASCFERDHREAVWRKLSAV
ncbi:protein phosphatase 1 regulatory subunit 15B-like [Scyliorhinus canicula]|uniref:protein phosphatase 1 regulatory subunit 15B-like n=1 Tax=Scyliorhinus canicula TaxID=7830 RepID=UPI0018F60D37|nr:protein phosphatase 1 regulatory subunit 15B-like [Scyliorhinus canicula]